VIVDGRDFLGTARRLTTATAESDWRSAISRGYYAVFHFFRDWLAGQGVWLGRAGQAHSNLHIGLLNCGIPAVASLAPRIEVLREERGVADYDLNRVVRQAHAQGIVQECDQVIADFQILLATVPAARTAAGVRSFLQSVGRPPP
jgi:hypothetical protein